ncbi:hypothetical protein SHL15_1393 [Streptomyces hygroscopicus subsp. limoneus]|nr:hypothetical protein SHL15_1393 [Streptomyces hygroscopicus subsp. limoneus]
MSGGRSTVPAGVRTGGTTAPGRVRTERTGAPERVRAGGTAAPVAVRTRQTRGTGQRAEAHARAWLVPAGPVTWEAP